MNLKLLGLCLAGALLTACDTQNLTSSPERERARVLAAQNGVRQIETALDMYRLDNREYPTEAQGLEALVSGVDGGNPVLQQLGPDPWGNAYQYRNPGSHGDIDVFSYGRDGAPGGEDFDADIGNWE